MSSSALYPGELVIGDDSPDHELAAPEGFGTGYDPSSRTEAGYGSAAEPFPSSLLIPRSEWPDRIAEMEKTKSRISDMVIQAGLPPKNQQQTNYCWCNAPTHCAEIVRVLQNEPTVILSPASVGAQVTGFRNVGGWGKDALDWIVAHGIDPVDIWPANAISRQYATDTAKATALKYRVTGWWVLDGSLNQLISCLLRNVPVAVGLSWWGHEVSYTDAVWVNGAIGVRFRNSWGPDWPNQGAGGWSILQGRKMYPDDAVAPRVVLAD